MEALILLVKTGQLKKLMESVALKSFDINIADDDGMTLLHYAAEEAQEEIVKWLLESGAVMKREKFDAEPIDLAYMRGLMKNQAAARNIIDLLKKATMVQEEVQKNTKKAQEEQICLDVKKNKEIPKEFHDLIRKLPAKPWLDIPKSEMIEILGDVKFSKLKRVIIAYHKLNKTDKKTLGRRIDLLNEASTHIQEYSTHQLDKKEAVELENLGQSIFGKMIYLKMLSKRELNKNWFLNFTFGGVNEKGQLLRAIRSDFCGDELYLSNPTAQEKIENATGFLDPCLRVGFRANTEGRDANIALFSELYKKWFSEVKKIPNNNTPSFYMWLEDKDSLTHKFIPHITMQAIELLELRK
jgi:hypothetical protein